METLELKPINNADFVNKFIENTEKMNLEIGRNKYATSIENFLSFLNDWFYENKREDKVKIPIECIGGIVKEFTFERDNFTIDMDENGMNYQYTLPYYVNLSMYCDILPSGNIKVADIGFTVITQTLLNEMTDKLICYLRGADENY